MLCSAYLNTQSFSFVIIIRVSIDSYEINVELMVITLRPEPNSSSRHFFPKCISYRIKKIVIHIKITIFLLIYTRKVCLGKGDGLPQNELMHEVLLYRHENNVWNVLNLWYSCACPWSYLSGCPGYLRRPHCLSIGLPEMLCMYGIIFEKNECMYDQNCKWEEKNYFWIWIWIWNGQSQVITRIETVHLSIVRFSTISTRVLGWYFISALAG